jgi:Ala-tRNA(Pro) deacylase
MTKEHIYKLLREENIEFELTEHEPLFSMDEDKECALPHPESMAKNLFVRDKKKRCIALITVKGDKRVDLNAFSLRQGLKRLSFSTAEMLDEIMHLKPGSVTPFGLLSKEAERVEFYFDEDFMGGIIGIHPCDNTATVWMKTDDLLQLLAARGHHAHITKIDRKED